MGTIVKLITYIFLLLIFLLFFQHYFSFPESKKKSPTKTVKNDFSTFLGHLLLSGTQHMRFEKIPFYPFFSDLTANILERGRKSGTRPQAALKKIKTILIKDKLFQKRLKTIVMEGYIQFSLISALTWSLVGFTAFMGITEISIRFKFFIFLLQLLAFLIYLPSYYYLKKKKTDFIQLFLKKLYLLQINLEASLSIKRAFEESQLNEVFKIRPKRFEIFLNRLEFLLKEFQKSGGHIIEELENLKEELWNEYQLLLEELEKECKVLRLGLIFLFFIPSYFLYIFAMLPSLN